MQREISSISAQYPKKWRSNDAIRDSTASSLDGRHRNYEQIDADVPSLI
jgi:hypothetical protein